MNPYEVLGISPCESESSAKAKYRKLCMKYHPDIAGVDSTIKFQEINDAWNMIKGTFSKTESYWTHKSLFSVEKVSL